MNRLSAFSACVASAACIGLAACASNPTPVSSSSRLTSREILSRFRLDSPADVSANQAAAEGLRVVGEPVESAGAEPAATGSLPPQGDASERLSLEDVLLSVEKHFPLILAALEEVEIAAGRARAAAGEFDTKLVSKNKFELEGFYEGDRMSLGFEQPTTLFGTRFEGGWRRGEGTFADFDRKAQTHDDGELSFGVMVPILQGRRVDPQRIGLWQARIGQQQAEPIILEKRLQATRKAASAYWSWVSASAKRRIAERLLSLAREREEQVRESVEVGQIAAINIKDNERLIAEREASVARAVRGQQEAAILLSLYWRGETGAPAVPDTSLAIESFPAPRAPEEIVIDGDVELALSRRPEVRALELELESLDLERELAENQVLPALDVGVAASQDYGERASSKDDKGNFELEARVNFAVPIQRRKATGKLREVRGKIASTTQKLRFRQDVVSIEVRDVVSALRQSWLQVEQAKRNVELAGELEDAERVGLLLGESDLFRVNVREQQTAVAAARLVDVQARYFKALTNYRAVLGLPYDEVLAGSPIGGTP